VHQLRVEKKLGQKSRLIGAKILLGSSRMFIAIEGCIGAGKTITAQLCAQRLGYEVLLERTEGHPFLHDFYADPARYAIETELAFVLIHYHQLHAAESSNRLIADFSPAKDLLFAEMNLSDRDRALFNRVYSDLVGRIEMPDFAIFLRLPIDELIRRIKERGRAYEMYMPRPYLEKLNTTYETRMDLLGDRVHILNLTGRESREDVVEQVLATLKHHLDGS
jgi:deoxyguanosine kinase